MQKKKFESNYILDLKTYREFSKGYIRFSTKIIILILLLIVFIINILFKNYDTVIGCCLIIFIFNIMFLFMDRNKIQYKRMLSCNNGKPNNNSVIVDDSNILILNNDTKNKNSYSFEQIIGINETDNLLILKMNYNIGIIISKNSLIGGSKDELIDHLLSNCPNIKKKKVFKSNNINKTNFILLIMMIIIFIISIVLSFLDKKYINDLKLTLSRSGYSWVESYNSSNYDLYMINKNTQHFSAYIYKFESKDISSNMFDGWLLDDDSLSINCNEIKQNYKSCIMKSNEYISNMIRNDKYIFFGTVINEYEDELNNLLEKINYFK